jgi:chaperonin GroES
MKKKEPCALDTGLFDIRLFPSYLLNRLICYALQRSKAMSTTVQPLADRVLVKRLEEDTKTASGIIIPDNSKEKPAQKVKLSQSVMDTLMRMDLRSSLTVKVGDKVLFEKFSGTEVKVNGEELLIMKEEKILGILQ